MTVQAVRGFESLPLRKMYYAYILQSIRNGSFYYGYSQDLEKRLKSHNAGKSKYTKRLQPWKIHYFEVFTIKQEAMKREKFFKSIEGYLWLKEKKII